MKTYINIFKALADKTRLRIIWILSKADTELCVCELTDALAESQYNVSRHLKELKIAGVIQDAKHGRWNFYALAQPTDEFRRCIVQAVSVISEDLLALDYERLQQRLALREDGTCVVGLHSEAWRAISLRNADTNPDKENDYVCGKSDLNGKD